MKWVGISGSWKATSAEVEKDVREIVRSVLKQGNGIVTGGALNVDYFATDEMLLNDPDATHVRVFLPSTLERYALHYRMRAEEGVITSEQAERLIAQLTELKRRNPDALIENRENEIIDNESYFQRNTAVVEVSDDLIAFQVNNSPGTQDTMEKARSLGKTVTLKQYSVP
jgi:predicted AlkP superfamily phosphohydrolase/phosphomutase